MPNKYAFLETYEQMFPVHVVLETLLLDDADQKRETSRRNDQEDNEKRYRERGRFMVRTVFSWAEVGLVTWLLRRLAVLSYQVPLSCASTNRIGPLCPVNSLALCMRRSISFYYKFCYSNGTSSLTSYYKSKKDPLFTIKSWNAKRFNVHLTLFYKKIKTF